jgi:hypothetical protein
MVSHLSFPFLLFAFVIYSVFSIASVMPENSSLTAFVSGSSRWMRGKMSR